MAILSSGKRIAVHQLFQSKASIAMAAVLASACSTGCAQSLFESMRDPAATGLSGYIFVSAKMPQTTLVNLARDAHRTGMTMVLNGYAVDGPGGMDATKQKVVEINRACCAKSGAHWQINPLLVARYKIRAVPTFVIARGTGNRPSDFAKISGEMSVANALKSFAQQSSQADIRRKATETYTRAFSTQ